MRTNARADIVIKVCHDRWNQLIDKSLPRRWIRDRSDVFVFIYSRMNADKGHASDSIIIAINTREILTACFPRREHPWRLEPCRWRWFFLSGTLLKHSVRTLLPFRSRLLWPPFDDFRMQKSLRGFEATTKPRPRRIAHTCRERLNPAPSISSPYICMWLLVAHYPGWGMRRGSQVRVVSGDKLRLRIGARACICFFLERKYWSGWRLLQFFRPFAMRG